MSERVRRWGPLLVALLAIAASIAGVRNGFTYDDKYIVELNPRTHDLAHFWRAFTSSYWPPAWGGDGYRPLTMLLFKLEWAIGRGSPLPFHLMNIALYAVAAVLVLVVARRIMPDWAALLCASLFAVHPVHVEAVANVVGQSELLVALFLLSATYIYLRDRQRGAFSPRTLLLVAPLYLLACLSKEHGVVLPAILFAAEVTLLDGGRTIRDLAGDYRVRQFYLALAAVAFAFVGFRSVVLSDHGIGGFQPFTPFSALAVGQVDRMLTAVGVVPQWLRLFYWPARLVSEYGPPEIPIAQGFESWQVPGFLLLFATVAFFFILRRRRPVIAFGIAFVVVALLPSSNFIVPAGIVLAERTLFTPSVGAMIVLAGVVMAIAEWAERRAETPQDVIASRRFAVFAVSLVVVAGIVRSALRSPVWQSNDRLFHQAVIDAPDSYRAHYMLGAWDFDAKQKRIGEEEYHRAMTLFPYDPFLAFAAGEEYRRVGMCTPAIQMYEWMREIDHQFPMGRAAYASCLLEKGRYDDAKKIALEAIGVGGELKQARRIIFLADSAKAADTGKRTAATVGQAGTSGKVPGTVQKTAGNR